MEEAGAVFDAFDHMNLDRFGGDAEALSDFLVGEAVEVAEHRHLAAALGESEDGFEKDIEALLALLRLGEAGFSSMSGRAVTSEISS